MTAKISPASTWIAIVIAGLSLLGALYAEYTHSDRDHLQRLSVVEANQETTAQRLDRMETKLDKLIEWALGKQ